MGTGGWIDFQCSQCGYVFSVLRLSQIDLNKPLCPRCLRDDGRWYDMAIDLMGKDRKEQLLKRQFEKEQ